LFVRASPPEACATRQETAAEANLPGFGHWQVDNVLMALEKPFVDVGGTGEDSGFREERVYLLMGGLSFHSGDALQQDLILSGQFLESGRPRRN
jgi:hypothetical protein